jgi:uncharacterized protein
VSLFTDQDGELAVKIARAIIEKKLGKKQDIPEGTRQFQSDSGVFVTLNTYPSKQLRGCIGYPEPVMALGKAIKDVAVSAATRDPRFPPVTLDEMDSIVIDVTLLTPPEDIDYQDEEDLIRKVKIGRDGLIAKRSYHSGLLLPQVPMEYNWSVEEFLSHTCMKAGLHPEEWRRGDVKFQRFQGRVFGEESPRGPIKEQPMN